MAKVTRGQRLHRRQTDAAETKRVNAISKTAERKRRDARMIAKLKAGRLPYTPTVMSWASRQLGKPASKITEADIKSLTK